MSGDYRMMAREWLAEHYSPLLAFGGHLDSLAALLSRVALEARPKWWPIETAPKDGTDIMLYTDRKLRRVGFFDEARDGVWSLWPGREQCWPTEWQPLPPPPGDDR